MASEWGWLLGLGLVAAACGGTEAAAPGSGGSDGSGGGADADEPPMPPAGVELRRSTLPYQSDPTVSTVDFDALQAAHRTFALNLYRQVAASTAPDQNLLLSPYSVSTILAMIYAGAQGNTAIELGAVLGFDAAPGALHPAMNELAGRLRALGDSSELRLSTLDVLWLRRDVSVEPAFLDVLGQQYDSGLYLVDFAGDAEGARVAINDWASNQTGGHVTDLLPPGAIDSRTQLALSNAIYLAAPWEYRFERANTLDVSFTLPNGTQVTVPMMLQEAEFPYLFATDYQAVELPYASTPVSLVAVVPTTGDLPQLEASFDDARLAEIVDGLAAASGYFYLGLPKFSFQSAVDLGPPLEQLGVVDAFSPTADFSGISTTTQLYIQTALQQAYIGVDEDATVAGAATGEVFTTVGATPSLHLNRPFLFFIYDRGTGTVLFIGRVASPA